MELVDAYYSALVGVDGSYLWRRSRLLMLGSSLCRGAYVAPLNVKTTLNVKTAKCEKPNNR